MWDPALLLKSWGLHHDLDNYREKEKMAETKGKIKQKRIADVTDEQIDKGEKKVKKAGEKIKKTAAEVTEDRELLKEAEEREKERKAEEKVEKEEAKKSEKVEKSHSAEASRDKKNVRRRSRHGKNYRKKAEQLEKGKEYPISEAIELALKTNPSKFDATVEAHIRINKKEKNIRGMITLSGGVAKEKKILAVEEKNVDDIISEIKAGKLNFDILIADLKVMPKLAILAKVLGPKGLMPSPKAGTAVEDVKKALEELKSGKVEYRADKDNIVHLAIGKVSFGLERIQQNYQALVSALPYKKIETIYLTTTMGPSVKISRK